MLKSSVQKFLVPPLKIGFAGGIIYWLVSTGKLDLKSISLMFQWPLIGICLLLVSSGLFLTAERWFRLIRIPLATQAPFRRFETFRLTLIGLFFNFTMPGGVGGDLVKAFYFYNDHRELKVVAISSILMDRLIGLYAMILMAFLAMLSDFSRLMEDSTLRILFFTVTVTLLAFTFTLALIFSERLHSSGFIQRLLNTLPFGPRFEKLYSSLHSYGANPMQIFWTITISLVAQFSSVLFFYALSQSIEPLPISVHLVAAPIGFIVTALPISPAGVGVGQAAFYFLYKNISHQENDFGPVAITAFQVATFLLSLAGALFYIMRKERPRPESLN